MEPRIGSVVAGSVVGNEASEETSGSPFSNRTSGKRIVKPSFKLKESPLFAKQDVVASTSSSTGPQMAPTPSKKIPENPTSCEDFDFVNCTPEEKPLIRASKLILNEKLLEKLRKPSQQVRIFFFYIMLGRNHVHLTVRLGFVNQHLWL